MKRFNHSIMLFTLLFAFGFCLSARAASLYVQVDQTSVAIGESVSISVYYVNGYYSQYVMPSSLTLSNSNATLTRYSSLSQNQYCGKLVPNKKGQVTVTARYGNLTARSRTISIRQSLTPPTPSASDGTYSSYVYVSWSSVSGASKYVVMRGTSSTYSSAKQLTTTSNTYYYDSSATEGTRYYYWILPVDNYNTAYYNSSRYDSGYKATVSQTLSVTLASSVKAGSSENFTVKYGNSYVIPSSISITGSSYASVTKYSSLLGGYSGYVKGLKAGTATITFTYAGKSVTKTITVTASSPNPTPTPSPSTGYISGPNTVRFRQTAYYKLYVGGRNVTSSARWSNGTYMTRRSNGVYYVGNPYISGKIVTISATFNGRTYSFRVTVNK
jgi:hypothetical protein